jgi:hypothetical protein
MKKFLTLMAAAAMALTACQNEEAIDSRNGAGINDDGAIIFGVSEEDNATRAVGMLFRDNTATGYDAAKNHLLLTDHNFGVFASYTGRQKYNLSTVRPDFMFNQKVTYFATGATGWTYEPVKYWPNSNKEYKTDQLDEYLSFFSYAPYVELDATGTPTGNFSQCVYGMSANDEEGDPWVAYQLSEYPFVADVTKGQVDLLYGINKATDTPWLDQQKPTLADQKLNFQFKHALACVGDKIQIKVSGDLASQLSTNALVPKVFIEYITINYKNLTSKAKLILNSDGTPKWQPIISGDYKTNREVKLYLSPDYADNTSSLYDADLAESEDAVKFAGKPKPIDISAATGISAIAAYPYLDSRSYADYQTYYSAHAGLTTGDVTTIEGKGLFYIPMELGDSYQSAEITVKYQVLAKDCEPYFGTVTKTVPLMELYNNVGATEEGNVLNIDIVLGKNLAYKTILYPKVGDPYFSDGTWGANEHAYGAIPIGVVGYIGTDIPGAQHGLVISMRDARMPNYDPNISSIPDWVKGLEIFDYLTDTYYHNFYYHDVHIYGYGLGLSQREAYIRWYYQYANGNDKDNLLRAMYFSHGGDIYDGSALASYSEAYADVNGEQHTKAMLDKWYATGSENLYPRQDAAYLCSQYEDQGVGAKGNWYMGSFGEWVRILDACATKSEVPGAGAVTTDAQANAIVPVTTYNSADPGFTTGRYYITAAGTDERLLMPASGNLAPTKGISNWIQIAATHFAPDNHSLTYDLMGTECTYWTSSQATAYYTYVFRLQYEQQCLNFYGNGDGQARVENAWNYAEGCRVRPILKF